MEIINMDTELKQNKKILIIGLDGGTFDIIKPFVSQGLLPNIAEIMKHSTYGVLESTNPPITAPAWASFMTGKNPGKHGVLQFFEFPKGERQLSYNFRDGKLINFSHIKESTIFELLGENGKKVISINIPLTYPPREINGKMISCWLTPPMAKNFTFPLSLKNEYPDYRIDQYFGEKIFALTPSGKQINAEEFFADINDVLEKRAKTAMSMISRDAWDLFMVCFTETDRVQHFFWRAINPEYSEFNTPAIQEERKMFINFYKKLDGYIGEMINKVKLTNTIVCIMSDHGFGPPPSKRFHMNYYLKKFGYLYISLDKNNISDYIISRINAQLRGYKAGRILLRDILKLKTEGASLAKQDDIDWQHTTAWSVCLNNNIGGIFFNYDTIKLSIDEFRRNIISKIMSVKNPQNNTSIVQHVIAKEELFNGKNSASFPDLFYILHHDYEAGIEGAFDLFSKSLISENPYPSGRGNHNSQGIFLFYGKDIQEKGEIGKRSIMDILPTVLYYLDVPIPDDLDGHPMMDIFEKDIINCRQLIYKKIHQLSYNDITENINNSQSEDSEDAIREKLKNLGYL